MNVVGEFLAHMWSYKLSVFPVLLTYLLFDAQAIVRRLTRKAYVPIYFMFFPLGHSDKLYAQYFNEDDVYWVGASMTPKQKISLRNRIRRHAIISMLLAAVFAPWVCGFLAALYLPRDQFLEFVWFLMIVKTLLIARALYELRANAGFVERSNSFLFLCVIYVGYLLLILRGTTKSYGWAAENLNTLGVLGTLWGLLDYAYVDIFINIFVVSAATWAVTTRYTDPALIPQPYKEESNDDTNSASTVASD